MQRLVERVIYSSARASVSRPTECASDGPQHRAPRRIAHAASMPYGPRQSQQRRPCRNPVHQPVGWRVLRSRADGAWSSLRCTGAGDPACPHSHSRQQSVRVIGRGYRTHPANGPSTSSTSRVISARDHGENNVNRSKVSFQAPGG
jgi:hypothetical protein